MQLRPSQRMERMSRLSYYSDRPMQPAQQQMLLEEEEIDVNRQTQNCCINWLKLWGLVAFTYVYILAFFGMSYGTETVQSCPNASRCVAASYMAGGGIHLGFFVVYVTIIGIAWAIGSRQRERIKREVVEKQLQRQRARQALKYNEPQ